LDEQKQHIQKRISWAVEWISWHACIFLKDTKEQIGSISFQNIREDIQSSEIWYWLWEDYWGKWYIFESLEKIMQVAFSQLNWESLIIRTDVPNVNSRKVAEKAWFTLDWILRNNSITQWKIVDVTHYSLTKEDYLSQK
jgi:ribosomal-protein-alanine N-acetyltransferase